MQDIYSSVFFYLGCNALNIFTKTGEKIDEQ